MKITKISYSKSVKKQNTWIGIGAKADVNEAENKEEAMHELREFVNQEIRKELR